MHSVQQGFQHKSPTPETQHYSYRGETLHLQILRKGEWQELALEGSTFIITTMWWTMVALLIFSTLLGV